MEDELFCVARFPRRGLVEDLALVLAAESVPYVVRSRASGWVLLVPLDRVGDAAFVLAAHEADGVELPRDEPSDAAGDRGPHPVGIYVGIALLAFHAWVVLIADRLAWLRVGRASSQRILDGELWRCVTALTLHSDPFHVLSNAVACAVFGGLLARAIGAAATLWVILITGAVGNFGNALFRDGPHLSIGASTAVFGLVGMLGGLQAMRYREILRLSRRAWVPLAGSVALLALLGSSPDSDFGAHVGGLVVGMVLGIAVPAVLPAVAAGRVAAAPVAARVATVAAVAAGVASWLVAWAA